MENFSVNQPEEKQISCVVCHNKISLNPHAEIAYMSQMLNYAVCNNGHIVHIEPCLKFWLLQSKTCPVCNTEYDPLLLANFQSFIDETKKQEAERKQNEAAIAQSLADIRSSEKNTDVIDKLSRAKKLIEEKKYPAALNVLFDLLDNNDPNNMNALFLIGKAQFFNLRYDLAISNLMKVVKNKFEFPFAFYYLGKSFQEVGLPDKAKWAFERAIINTNKLILSGEKDLEYDPKEILKEINSLMKSLKCN